MPQRAVQDLQGQYQVGVVGSDSKVEMRTVKAGEKVGSLWIIDAGLKPEERVIVEGLQKVRAGEAVKATLVTADAGGERPPASAPSATSAETAQGSRSH